MKHILCTALSLLSLITPSVRAQKSPEAGYVFPAGGKAGTTIDVKFGGYDWTTDMEFVVHDKRVHLTPTGTLGPILLPPPPYWFGAKGRLASMPLPREISAKITIPAGVLAGPIYWQVANANGVTEARVFIIGDGLEIIEDENRKTPQILASLPMTVSGRLAKNEEVDRYRFTAGKDGPITCELMARRLGSKFVGILQVHDAGGKLIEDALGTSGADPALTFVAKAGAEYIVSLHDIDFGGDRSYVYRLSVMPGPRIVGAIPAAGKRGETREVEFIVDNGTPQLASIKRSVAFPAKNDTVDFRLDPASMPFRLLCSDDPGITGVLDQPDAVHQHAFTWKKDDVWLVSVDAKSIGSPLDVSLAVVGPDGKELARNDDLPGTIDAGLEFGVPADGIYKVVVSDTSGKSGSRASIYRLTLQRAKLDFALQVGIQRLKVPIGGQNGLIVSAKRSGYQGPIRLSAKGLLPDITVSTDPKIPVGGDLMIPSKQTAFVIYLHGAKEAGTHAGLITIEGTADLASTDSGLFSRSGPPPQAATTVTRTATAHTNVNLTPRSPDDGHLPAICIATTLKPRFKGQPVDQDTGRKVHRGSTHPADIIIERFDGFGGEIILQQAATQSYQVQGISGTDVIVPPGINKAVYPCFMPEWLETTRTSRMGIVAVAKVPDPKGKVRWVCNDITGFVTMTMEGALLKVSADEADMTLPAGQPFEVRLKIARLTKLNEAVKLELKLPDGLTGQLKAEPITIPVKQEQTVMRVTPTATVRGLHTFTVRGTAMQDGKWLTVSEAHVTVEFVPVVQAPPK